MSSSETRPTPPDDVPRYQCVGICMADPDSGYCLGCGRPPETVPVVVAESAPPSPEPTGTDTDPDSPGS